MNRTTVDGAALEFVQIAAAQPATALAPLVFLHEGLGSVAMWRDWPAQLCRETGRAGLVYSRRGYGHSDATPDARGEPALHDGRRTGRLRPDYLHHEALVVLPAMLGHFGLVNPVLVGHSDGGSIALIHAGQHPVSACIAMAPHVMVEDVSLRSIRQTRQAFEQGDLRARLARYHADVDGAFWQWNDIWLDPGFRGFDIRPECRNIHAPVLALQGVDDPYGTTAQLEQIDLPSTLLTRAILEACGHSPHRDQTERTNGLIRHFLGRVA